MDSIQRPHGPRSCPPAPLQSLSTGALSQPQLCPQVFKEHLSPSGCLLLPISNTARHKGKSEVFLISPILLRLGAPVPSALIFPITSGIKEGNSNPLQCSCLENPMDREVWQATVHGVAKVRHDLATEEREREASRKIVQRQEACFNLSVSLASPSLHLRDLYLILQV